MMSRIRPSLLLHRNHRAGFTLVEVIVTVGIIAILISLTAVGLRRTLQNVGAMKSLVNLKNLGLTLSLYAEANRGQNPYIEAGTPLNAAPPEDPNGFLAGVIPVWFLDIMWPTLMHEVAPWPENFETWLSPGNDRRPPYWPIPIGNGMPAVSYRYCNSFLGNPIIWSGEGGVTEEAIGATLVTSVIYPSAKVIMYDADRSYLGSDTKPTSLRPLLFVDGSARLERDQDATAPVQNALYYRSPRLYHDTPKGINGRDF